MSDSGTADGTILRGPRRQAWVWFAMGILYLAMGVVFGYIGIAFGLHSSGVYWGTIAGAAFVALGIVWSVRALDARVVVTETELIVHGYLLTRRIPRRAIIGFGMNGSVEWTTRNGTQRTTMIFVLRQMRPVSGSPGILAGPLANDAVDRIKAWAEADHHLTQNW